MDAESLAALLAQQPRVALAELPTPLHDCPRLSAAVGDAAGRRGPRILIKRDDLTGLALGGNKTRKLEFVLGDAIQAGADTIVTSAAAQSNLCRQTAAAGARLGLPVHLVLQSSAHDEPQGNLLLDHLFGAHVRLVHEGAALGAYDMGPVRAEVARLSEALRREGRTPYVISMQTDARTQAISVCGYLNATLELQAQCAAAGLQPTHLVVTSGSGGTHASLALGARLLGLPYEVIGISIRKPRAEALPGVAGYANSAAEHFDLPVRLAPEEVTVYDEYFGEGYGIPTAAGLRAIQLAARTEGILLDPVYTGKTMSGLIGLVERGVLTAEHTVVFVHTGGVPALFAYNEELMAAQQR